MCRWRRKFWPAPHARANNKYGGESREGLLIPKLLHENGGKMAAPGTRETGAAINKK